MYSIQIRKTAFILFLLGAFACVPLSAQSVYSYVDDTGVRVLTNIPPKGPVHDLISSGAPQTPSAAATSSPATAPRATRYDPIIQKYADQYHMDPALIRSIIATESGFNEKAVSSKGARGLMQLMPATASLVGVRNAFDPEENIRGGVRHMASLLNTFNNDLPLSLAAYNAGQNLVMRTGRIPNIRETQDYVRSVTRRFGKTQIASQQATTAPQMFRFTDNNGVLHLTNLPPVQRSE